jgi:hypothetical protein
MRPTPLPGPRVEGTALACMLTCLLVPPAIILCWPCLSFVRWMDWRSRDAETDRFSRLAKAVPLALASGIISLAPLASASLVGVLIWSKILERYR